jgi:hypothetical protein
MSPSVKVSTEEMANQNVPYGAMLSMLAQTPMNPFNAITNPVGHATVGNAAPVLGNAATALLGNTAPTPAAADLTPDVPAAKSGMNPYLLGAAGVGGLGLGALGAYGLSRMMGRKKRRDEE